MAIKSGLTLHDGYENKKAHTQNVMFSVNRIHTLTYYMKKHIFNKQNMPSQKKHTIIFF